MLQVKKERAKALKFVEIIKIFPDLKGGATEPAQQFIPTRTPSNLLFAGDG